MIAEIFIVRRESSVVSDNLHEYLSLLTIHDSRFTIDEPNRSDVSGIY